MWNERYGEPGFAYGTEPNDFLVESVARIPRREGTPSTVLAIAEGEGRNAVWLAGQGFAVHAMDQSDVGLAKARELASSRGVTITTEVGDLATFELGEARWDAVVSIWAHTPPAIRARVHGAIGRALRPGGVFVLEAYTPAQLALGTGGPRDAAWLMSLALLRDELAGLELEVAVERERDVHEGRFHEGKSAVVQVVARRR